MVMAKFGDIVGYSFRADLYCPNCIVRVYSGDPPDSDDTEACLNRFARDAGIDREDERTFDSDEFPKVVLFDHLHDQGERFYCGNCHNELES
jgi:hypothetical protein